MRSQPPTLHAERGLAAVFALLALLESAYALWPPFGGTPTSLDVLLAVVLGVLVVVTLLVVPRLDGTWPLDVLLGAGWLTVALVAGTRPSLAGQVLAGTMLMIVAIYAASATSGIRFAAHLSGMLIAYALVAYTADQPGSAFFTVALVTASAGLSLVTHRFTNRLGRYQLVLHNTSDAVVQDCDGEIVWISPSITRLLGWTPEECVGLTVSDLVVTEDQKDKTDPDDVGADDILTTPESGIMQMRRRSGGAAWIEYTVHSYSDRGHTWSVSTWRDITERVQAQQAARRWERSQREEARKTADLAETKARLFQNLSHELRTPLAVIGGPLHDLQHRDDLTSPERTGLDAAIRAHQRMTRLIDGLLDVAQGQEKRLRLSPEPTDLITVTRGATQMFASMAANAGIDLSMRVGEIRSLVMIDPDAWITILVNLVSNALKFTKSGAVRVLVETVDGRAHLVVNDTGVGIPESDLPHVFDRYERSPMRPVRGEAGSGIGLALVHRIIEAAGGRAHVESRVGIGTTVEVWLPAPSCTPHDHADTEHHLDIATRRHAWAWSESAPAAVLSEPPSLPLERGRILVVEDNIDLRRYLVDLLHSAGWETTAVPDAESAYPLVGDHDLVVADVMLPGSSGVDLVSRTRSSDGPSRWVPIVLLTARAGNDAVVEGLSAGADDYVTKPFAPRELLARISTHVELSFLRKVVLQEANQRAANLERALESNRAIGTALGIIMASEHVNEDEAFARLRAASQHTNRKLRDVAEDVIYTGTLSAVSRGKT